MKLEFEVLQESFYAVSNRPAPIKPTYYSVDTVIHLPSGTSWGMSSEFNSFINTDTKEVEAKDILNDKEFIIQLIATTLNPTGYTHK